MAEQQASKAKGRKIGRCRNSPSHKAYIAEGRYDKNKLRKLKKHCARFPEDSQAASALKRLSP